MLATLNDVMKIAEEKKIAIGSFNTPNLESLQAVIGAAEELDIPVIIQFAQCLGQLFDIFSRSIGRCADLNFDAVNCSLCHVPIPPFGKRNGTWHC